MMVKTKFGNQIAPIELAQQFESLAEKAQTDENFIHLDYEDVKKRFETYMDWIAALCDIDHERHPFSRKVRLRKFIVRVDGF